MAEILKPDLCVVGAGALGIDLAIKGREKGLAVLLVDREVEEPGDIVRGGLQRAALVASAARAQAIRTAAQLGLETIEPKPNFRAITELATAVAEAAVPRDAAERLTALGIAQLSGAPRFIDRRTLAVGEASVRARHFVLATGARTMVPNLVGLDQIPYLTPDTIVNNVRKLSHLLIVGADAPALELAQVYRRLGSDVTLVPGGPMLPGHDREAQAILLRFLGDEGVVILEGASVTAIVRRSQGTGINLRLADGTESALDVSHVLLATARIPDLDEAMLAGAGLRRDRVHPARLQLTPAGQTSNRRISTIGGAAGQVSPIAAAQHMDRLLDRLTGTRSPELHAAGSLQLVATSPALAQVGPPGLPARPGQVVLRASLAENDGARANRQPLGLVKIVVDGKGKILSGVAVGEGAGEIAALLSLAIDRGMNAADLTRLPVPDFSAAAVLPALGAQSLALHPPTGWAKRVAALRRLLP